MLEIRSRTFDWGSRTYVMGIVNATPDSFSGDGLVEPQLLADHAERLWTAGADILDVGGESTRPGYRRIDESVELERVLPAIRAIRERCARAPISVDTYKPAVARAACAAGADAINSVWGADDALLDVAAEFDVPFVAMHNQDGTHYAGDVVAEVAGYLLDCARRAEAKGIARERIWLDPGIGFGKTADHNLAVLQRFSEIVALGYPTLIGWSRKSTIGKLTGEDAHLRVFGTTAANVLAASAGADIVRVHDVAAACQALRVTDAVVRGWRPAGWTG
ncbi:MAG TPA: dihydropteroate synthase [Candidatus Tumulicola sp.]